MKFTRRQFNQAMAGAAGLAALGPAGRALAARDERVERDVAGKEFLASDDGGRAENRARVAAQHEATDALLDAMRQVLRGEVYLSARMTKRILHQKAHRGNQIEQSPLAVLSDRELHVFRLIGQGMATRHIAQRADSCARLGRLFLTDSPPDLIETRPT